MGEIALKWFLSFAILSAMKVDADASATSAHLMCGIVGYALDTDSFTELTVMKTQKLCFDLCLAHPNCKSTNYLLKEHRCALNGMWHLDSSVMLREVLDSFYAYSGRLVSVIVFFQSNKSENISK